MRKIISFCLFGDNPLYTTGAIENLTLAKELYPAWEIHFYIDEHLENELVSEIIALGGHIHVIKEQLDGVALQLAKKMYWRMLALNESSLERVIFRDCDSRLSDKELQAVLDWERSNKAFHFMYDHEWHTTPILGGMWGVKGDIIKSIDNEIQDFFSSQKALLKKYSEINDQIFLKNVIWNKYVTDENYIAHGNLELCKYHLDLNIKITPYPFHKKKLTADGQTCFIGQVVNCPDSKPKINKKSLNE